MIRGKHLVRTLVWICLIGAITATAAATSSPREADQVNEAVKAWAKSWDRGDIGQYLRHYADNFVPAGGLSRLQWEHQRRNRLKISAIRYVMLRDIEVAVKGDTAQAEFTQHYLDMDLMSTARKRLMLIKQAGEWKIREEQVETERMVRR